VFENNDYIFMDNGDDTFVMNMYGQPEVDVVEEEAVAAGNATTTISGNQTAVGNMTGGVWVPVT
jgi:hypothetical protein